MMKRGGRCTNNAVPERHNSLTCSERLNKRESPLCSRQIVFCDSLSEMISGKCLCRLTIIKWMHSMFVDIWQSTSRLLITRRVENSSERASSKVGIWQKRKENVSGRFSLTCTTLKNFLLETLSQHNLQQSISHTDKQRKTTILSCQLWSTSLH